MLSLYFNWAPRRGGVLRDWKYSSTHSLTSALDGGEWSASRPGRFTPRERALGTNWIRGWLGPRAVLDALVKRKIPIPCRESNPRTLIVQPVAQLYTGWDIIQTKISWAIPTHHTWSQQSHENMWSLLLRDWKIRGSSQETGLDPTLSETPGFLLTLLCFLPSRNVWLESF
jgi:hypothetical protein